MKQQIITKRSRGSRTGKHVGKEDLNRRQNRYKPVSSQVVAVKAGPNSNDHFRFEKKED